ncbi:hypothetical protein [Nocardia abscessus]|uniref:hypothetical protein n=1 Tax=Nocardia abscessus TaxID=120957 RepID=UPI0024586B00|nr:hypothetical protein [Nocardia abscessus]
MDDKAVNLDRLDLKDDQGLLSPPWIAEPLYQCGTAVTVFGFVPHAEIDIELDGVVAVSVTGGFPEPVGETAVLPAPLVAGQSVRVRQRFAGATSAWSGPATVRDHSVDYPAGPPRPQINPSPVLHCGSRTGVANLVGGGTVWITAEGTEVGRVDGCATPQQGVNVNPFYGPGQKVRAHFELCGDQSPASVEHTVQPGPSPLPTPGFDPVYEGGEQIRITNIANGARVSVIRSGAPLGTFRCWGGALLVALTPPLSTAEPLEANQQLCPTDPSSATGSTDVQPCAALPAPKVGPVQAGDTHVVITSAAPGTQSRVYRNFVQVGLGGAPIVNLTQTLLAGDTVHVVQELANCRGQLALELTVACVDPPYHGDPAAVDLFPVGFTEYADGSVKGSVYYPADDDVQDAPFNTRVAGTGRVPVVVMAHGNHNPADPSYLGYDYFQRSLARMGIVALSVDCNALNGAGAGVGNIEDRADLIIDSIKHFQMLDATPGSVFAGRLDFDRVGLMGHSRGGDAIVMVPEVIGPIGVTIRAGLALAPTNFRYWSGMPTIAPSGYAFMTLLPAADGDVVDNNGAQFYDRAKPDPFKCQLYIHSTNHNFFNRQWALDDGVTPVLCRGSHERFLDVYGCALFRSQLLGHGTDAYLTGNLKPEGIPTGVVYLAYEQDDQVTVDNHEDGNGIAKNSLGLSTSQTALSAKEYPFDQVGSAFNSSFFGLTVGMVVQPDRTGAVFRTEIDYADVTDREVWLRVADVATGSVPAGSAGFELGLEDGSGVIGWIDSDAVGGVPRPFDRPDVDKTMLSTLRFKAGCARSAQGTLDLRNIVAILFRFNRTDNRALAFDDLQLVQR